MILLWQERELFAPLHLSFLSSEQRQPVRLAIRTVIWQAVQSAFTLPLHLLNILKPSSVTSVHIKTIKSWKRPQRTDGRQMVHRSYVLIWSARLSEGKYGGRVDLHTRSQKSSQNLLRPEIADVDWLLATAH